MGKSKQRYNVRKQPNSEKEGQTKSCTRNPTKDTTLGHSQETKDNLAQKGSDTQLRYTRRGWTIKHR